MRDGNVLTVLGTFTGTAAGAPVTDTRSAVVDLQQSTGMSEILDVVVLGPLNLDLLGLVTTLDTLHLNITADLGPGNLLGSLLGNLRCAVAGLLDGATALNALVGQITRLLNQLLGAHCP